MSSSSTKKKPGLAVYVQKTLMQFLPAVLNNANKSQAPGGGNNTPKKSTATALAKSNKSDAKKSKTATPVKGSAKKATIVNTIVSSSSESEESDSDEESTSSSDDSTPEPPAKSATKGKQPAAHKKKATSASAKNTPTKLAPTKSSSKKKSPVKKEPPKSSQKRAPSPVNDEDDDMSDVDDAASSTSSPASAAIAPSASPKSKPNGKKRKKSGSGSDSDNDGASTRPITPPLRTQSRLSSDDEADVEPDRRTPSKVKHIDLVQIGNYELTTWYHSPYPDPYRTAKKLFVCEFCLKYCKEYKSLQVHQKECALRSPPGKLIYRDPITGNCVFEIDGGQHKLYAQCLTLFAKLFIDHKTLYFDVDPFMFYVLTEPTNPQAPAASPSSSPAQKPPSSPSSAAPTLPPNSTHQIVAYFSKEKQSPDQFNVSCILTFPQYQRKGYGKFLIALSYELSRREKRIGSPEKPLSELGKVSYRSYWVSVLLTLLSSDSIQSTLAKNKNFSILDICNLTSIKKEDVISALESVQLIQYKNGEHILDCTSKASKELLQRHKAKQLAFSKSAAASGMLEFKPELLHWKPPPNTLTSPSVSFPESAPASSSSSRKKTHSHAKKRIKY